MTMPSLPERLCSLHMVRSAGLEDLISAREVEHHFHSDHRGKILALHMTNYMHLIY